MQDIPFILSECQDINSLLYLPISATQRIKYTCFNASLNYIVIGSTSGSLYLFNREPCSFQQLIPLSEGAVTRVQISPDEKVIALSTVRGSVCLITVKPSVKLTTISTEHLGERITSLCWNDTSTEIYVGDGTGKVSVHILATFSVNGIFQSPSCALMDLDSSIVQMNYTCPLLLVSTLTRCYICDTKVEQYKQIGNKARDGEFGACFLNTYVEGNGCKGSKPDDNVSNGKHTFSLIAEDEHTGAEGNLPKIYCARPGSRLWEVAANGSVIKTHQFKDALAIAPFPIYRPQIKEIKFDQKWPAQSINFSQLFVVKQKYLFSYTSNGLYIIDPMNAAVVLWSNEFSNISAVHVVNDKIYLMSATGIFHCLSLSSVDSLILKLYEAKSYDETLQLCQSYRPHLLKSIIKDIEEPCDKLSEILLPIITLLKSNYNAQPRKLESGIVMVNSGNVNGFHSEQFENEIEDVFVNLNVDDNLIYLPKLKNVKGRICDKAQLESDKLNNKEENTRDLSTIQTIMCSIQTSLEPIYLSLNCIKSSMNEKEVEDVIQDAQKLMIAAKQKYDELHEFQHFLFELIRSAELRYINTFLENLSLELLHTTESSIILDEATRAFMDANSSKYGECNCGFPFPVTGSIISPKYAQSGKILLRKFSSTRDETCVKMCNRVPYLWREYLNLRTKDRRISDSILKQCLRTRDSLVISMILPMIDRHQWKLLGKCIKDLERGHCLMCGENAGREPIERDLIVDWMSITHELIKIHGPDLTMTFLNKVEEYIPEVSLSKSTYHSLIFSKILERYGVKHAVELNRSGESERHSICSPKVREELTESLEKDLERPIREDAFGTGPHHWGMRYTAKTGTCPCCTLSLQTPVLLGNNGIALFPCGHAYHVNCMIKKKITRCNLHSC